MAVLANEHPRPGPRTALPEIEIDRVTVRFSTRAKATTALADVSFDVAPREFVSIVGPSGCGKSTLLKLIAGLVEPSSGQLRIRGEHVRSTHSGIGFVFQKAALLEWRNVRRNITIQGELRKMPRRDVERRADRLMEMTGLREFASAMPHELSGGMQQRASLCRALLHEPAVLLMDEPFGALDALTRESMNVELRRIWKETGTTVVLVTHSVAEAVYLSNRVVAMSARPGRVIELIDIDLPDERDYAETMGTDVFGSRTAHLRSLLGTHRAGAD